jgi:hypothetical protein
MMIGERVQTAGELPPFRVSDVRRIDGGSLRASFDLRIFDGAAYLRGAKYYTKDGRAWVRCSHKDDRGSWVVDVLFSDEFSDAIAQAVADVLEPLPPKVKP